MSPSRKDKKIQEDIDKLIAWAQKRGFDVYINHTCEDRVEFNARSIEVSTRQNLENQLYSFAHECGHILLYSSKNYKQEYAYSNQDLNGRINRSIRRAKQYKVELIREETEAWHRGKKLLKRLDCHLDEKKFDEVAAKHIYGYIEDLTGEG